MPFSFISKQKNIFNCIVLILLFFNQQANSQTCGVERWAIKTLSDKDTQKINFKKIIPTTIHEQINLKKSFSRSGRMNSESIVYSLPCAIVGYKLEEDQDIHIIIEDTLTEETMVIELISPYCESVKKTSRYNQFKLLSEWFYKNIGVPSHRFVFLKKHIPVTITGVGFFDFCHGQKGMAENCREIHPVLSMRLNK